MAPVYADHPFNLIETPISKLPKDVKPDMFDNCASEMACVHNMMIRGINSIYLQAPHITAKDEQAFLNYVLQWYALLHVHHTGEETTFFPAVEELAGEKGIMEANVEQHHAFESGLEAFVAYIRDAIAKKEKYDGKRIVALIDAFAEPLRDHLADEIPTILGLRKYGDKMAKLQELFDHEGETNMKMLGLTLGMPWCFVNLDIHFEEDRWINWPPAPAPVKFIVRYLAYWIHSDYWKFGACDRAGNMKPLYAVPADASEKSA